MSAAGHERVVVVAVEQLRREVPGGIGRYARGLLGGLRGLGDPGRPGSPPGLRVELLASRHRGPGPDPLSSWGFPVRTSSVPAPFLTLAWDRGLAPVRAAGLVHSVSLAAPPVHPGHRDGGPVLVETVHDLAWRTHPEATTPRGRRWHEAALGRALERADAFVVPSPAVSAQLVTAGADAGRVQVIPHGVDHLPAPDAAGARALLGRLGVVDGYLLAAATLEPRKNLGRLVAAFARARPSLAGPWPLVVVGPRGWGDSGLGAAAAGGVLAAGAVDDGVLAALYEGARAFAYVPLAEGFGLPPLEAMACGAPVVVSDATPGTPPGTALVVDPTTVEAIASALVRASGDDELRVSLVAKGKALVAPLTWRASAAAHLSWWGSLR
jgi:glycosyltransferase involved in cell wall biosynthesis